VQHVGELRLDDPQAFVVDRVNLVLALLKPVVDEVGQPLRLAWVYALADQFARRVALTRASDRVKGRVLPVTSVVGKLVRSMAEWREPDRPE
jgi:hypothetical protein